MPTFDSYDGTMLSYRVIGAGEPLVCYPGGPGRSIEYLGDLGGLSKSRQLILLDPRGVGESADPADPATFRVDRLVDDVDALRAHLGLDRMDLLAHSAGSVLATLYAAAHPQRLSKLVLITPGLAATGVDITEEDLRAGLKSRSSEPWYTSAIDAMEKIMTGDRSLEAFRASRPFYYGRWDETAQAHAAAGMSERHQAAREGYFAGVTIDPPAIGAGLKKLAAPVLLYAGDLDPLVPPALVKQAAPVFPDASVIVQGGAGHFPWIDDPGAFADNVAAFLIS
ncbi:MAG TPA: alpha/beta hydrolase [Streptosporangiaceae bacterium]|nr:alpha/beta hydrolase [Streptosporangiaceae bacterium]